MKKFLSVVLIISLIASFSAPAFAGSDKCSCGITPVVYVQGFGEPVYQNPSSENRTSVFPPEGDAITDAVPSIVKAVFFGLLTGDFDNFGTNVIEAANIMLGNLALDNEGNPINNTGIRYREPESDTHKLPVFNADDEDSDGRFSYIYDWRTDPIDNAKGLREYIEKVKALTGHSEVVLCAHSQGNTIVASYLHLFGSKDIEKLVLLSPAYQGLSLIGSLFTGEVSLLAKGDALAEYLNGTMGYEDIKSTLIEAVIKKINEYGTVDGILYYLQQILDDQLDRVFADALTDIFATMPGIWSFVPDEYYENAKEYIFNDNGKYDILIKKIDYYHYNVQTELDSILRKAVSNGTDVIITAGYNISSIPVTVSDEAHSDFLIDTEYMSIGATCAPFGAEFEPDYKQINSSCGHNHISPDRKIDASTCLFPEYTWFIKNNGHSEFGSDYCKFIEWAIRFNGQPSVNTNPAYPQFMQTNGDSMFPVEGKDTVDNRSNSVIIITSLFELFKESLIG